MGKCRLLSVGLGIIISLTLAAVAEITYLVKLQQEVAESDLKKYENYFNLLADAYGAKYVKKPVVFMFDSHPGNIIGLCYMDTPIPVITIERRYWDAASEPEKMALMFHELGHCLLRRPHLDTVDEDGCAGSLMHSIASYGGCFPEQMDKYLKELFDNSAVKI
jgi:hypothetical protein